MGTENAVGGSPGRAARAEGESETETAPGSLEGLNSSVPIPSENAGFWRQYRAFVGPAFLVCVGYMDPGNWGTDLQAGASFRYGLLWVVAVSSFMAIIMQVCAARLGIVTGKDLAQACRDFLPSWTRWPNWFACELAIGACDLAEVLGSAVALNLLFHIPLFWAVLITAFDVLLILAFQGIGMRFIEALIVTLVATIGGCYFIEIFVLPQTTPSFLEMGSALLTPGFRSEGMLLGAIGIIGATVMPHNLYLHSALVRTRQLGFDEPTIRRAIKFNTIDTVLALSLAFLVNSAILVLAATTFYGREGAALASGEIVSFDKDADWIRVAYLTLAPLLGAGSASALFAVALLASGQSSTITGTLAGQVVMEGFTHWRIRPWVRRFVTRAVAILPAVVVIGVNGSGSVTDLLVLSQVVLAVQLPLAMFPLLYFTSSKQRMGRFRNGWFLLTVGWASCLLITALIVYGLPEAVEKAWAVIAG
ncbi:Nramp family divalent metal transporter [Frigoriglobus tundricola]|uniref:Divalent metal cation transporter MntH n=1 Tax=Frigoriglobus tundricola TaxID=2774151 RepID=A0A6M5YTC6_9BACT|nr:Nramp family divalent metal transporter [Frigoriglobus tundricola]QJW96694.1 Manganese transport protein MntH [Frigoriglobus tundricola]